MLVVANPTVWKCLFQLANTLFCDLCVVDGEFFKRRRENALRRQREDELEASTITGVTKRQGSLVQKSTRGFLGRIMDFIGILLIGIIGFGII